MSRSPSNKSRTPTTQVQPDPEEVQRAFGRKVRELRQAAELTIEDLAELSTLHPSYVGGVERGVRNLSLVNIWRLANGLSVSATMLLSDLPKPVSRSKKGREANARSPR
ncbi:MAG: XRE family transcriptional regulator [Alcaligenaceae bacterium]|nr:MAG: XRE family transcriptional regulator [Alcaligenaceae bacterium]